MKQTIIIQVKNYIVKWSDLTSTYNKEGAQQRIRKHNIVEASRRRKM